MLNVAAAMVRALTFDLGKWPHVHAWLHRCWDRPAAKRALAMRGIMSGEAVEWLRAWDSQGFHRTATDGDEAGAVWLAREAAALGATVTSETFALDRIDPIDTCLELEDGRIDAVPVFDAPPTGPRRRQRHAGPGRERCGDRSGRAVAAIACTVANIRHCAATHRIEPWSLCAAVRIPAWAC